MGATGIMGLQQTTSYKVVLPFYVYAAISLLLATGFLLFNTHLIAGHYFSPRILAIVHIMALGWGTMIIFGASHQLLPVLVEGKLDSNLLAYMTFVFAGLGIPFLVIGFYQFHTGWLMQIGAVLVNIGVLCYLANVLISVYKSDKHDVHSWFMATAAVWLFTTTFYGLLLVFNFSISFLPDTSVTYLAIHAHLGLIGWFILLILGVGARLIPMFLISKYTNRKILWMVYGLVNLSLITFLMLKVLNTPPIYYYLPTILGFIGVAIFGNYCRMAYKVRIRKAVDGQMKISLFSVVQMLLPFVVMLIVLLLFPAKKYVNLTLLYGFCIFFGWITAIILGMTFKTLPFIVWNKVYHQKARIGRTPVPKELFNEKIYYAMAITYIVGFIVFFIGIVLVNDIVLKIGAVALFSAAILYVNNVIIILLHQAKTEK